MKKKDEELITLRLSGRSKLTKEAAEVYQKHANKSAFLTEAIEFYVSFGQSINDQLKEINEKIDSLKGGVHISVPVSELESSEPIKEGVPKDEVSKEEEFETEEKRKEREAIQNTLSSFMSFSGGGD